MSETQPPVTPDGRYLVVRGRLWRGSNPALAEVERERLVSDLMATAASGASRPLVRLTRPAAYKTDFPRRR